MSYPMCLRAKRAANLGGWFSCGKIAYLSKSRATKNLKRIRQDGSRDRTNDWQLGVYQCGMCSLWHVGHSRPRKPGRRPGIKETS